uniref:Uncharacterized protein n=1 Tax=Anguilla anguilla TaxID=7936 RepID=A0A0E9XCQ2_ANGAN
MPQYRNPFEKGDLFIKFDVQFPSSNWISPEKLSVSNKSGLYPYLLFKWKKTPVMVQFKNSLV